MIRHRLVLLSFACLGFLVLSAAIVTMKHRVDKAYADTERARAFTRAYSAIVYYDQKFGRLPMASTGSHGQTVGWRLELDLRLAEMLGNGQEIRYDFSRPWNDDSNLRVEPVMIPFCQNGIDTRLLAVVGDTAFADSGTALSLSDFDDGRENTILIVWNPHLAVPWQSPDDLSETDFMTAVSNGGVIAVFSDGRPFELSSSMPPELLQALLTPNGGERVSRAKLVEEGLILVLNGRR